MSLHRAESPTVRQRVRILLSGEGAGARIVSAIIYGLTIAAACMFAAETVPHWREDFADMFDRLELIFAILFTAEYAARAWSNEKPLRYIFSFWGIIDFLASVPALVLLGTDVDGLRTLRLLRLTRLLKLFRVNQAEARLHEALRVVAPELVVFLCFATITIFFAATGIYFFEHEAQPEAFASVPHSLWWAVVTLTTVGYGDVYPITVGGKLFTTVLLLVGLSVVAIPTGIFSTALMSARGSQTPDEDA